MGRAIEPGIQPEKRDLRKERSTTKRSMRQTGSKQEEKTTLEVAESKADDGVNTFQSLKTLVAALIERDFFRG